MKIKGVVYIIFVVLTFVTAVSIFLLTRNEEKPKLNNIYLEIPEKLPILFSSNESKEIPIHDNPFNHSYKFITIVDGNCTFCLEKLLNWNQELENFDTTKIDFYFVLTIHDSITFEYHMKPRIDFPLPLYLDYSNSIYKKNEFLDQFIDKSFLLNDSNIILLRGDPLYNEKIGMKYQNLGLFKNH